MSFSFPNTHVCYIALKLWFTKCKDLKNRNAETSKHTKRVTFWEFELQWPSS